MFGKIGLFTLRMCILPRDRCLVGETKILIRHQGSRVQIEVFHRDPLLIMSIMVRVAVKIITHRHTVTRIGQITDHALLCSELGR